MDETLTSFYNLIGKEIVERYGRFRGKILGIEADADGKIKNIVFENGGVILTKKIDFIKVSDGYVEVAPPSIISAENMLSKLNMLKVQYEIMLNLKLDDGLDDPTYKCIKADLDNLYRQIGKSVEDLMAALTNRRKTLEERKKWIHKMFFNLDVARRINALEEEKYADARRHLDSELLRINKELEDIDLLTTELSLKVKELSDMKDNTYVEQLQDAYKELENFQSLELKVDAEKLKGDLEGLSLQFIDK